MRVTAAFFLRVRVRQISVLAQQSSDHRQIEQLISRYARSIDAADTTLAAEIWSQSPDVSFIHPLGHEHGFGAVKQNVTFG
jgi:hypothetical protein